MTLCKRGFTLIEAMIVTALLVMFITLGFPIGFSFFQEFTLKDQAQNLENTLQKAQTAAITKRGDTNVGVMVTSDAYTMFEGESYEERRRGQDVVVRFDVSVDVGGEQEIVFEKETGKPVFDEEEEERVLVITLSAGNHIRHISITPEGKIESYHEE